jgi:hypothetical protein
MLPERSPASAVDTKPKFHVPTTTETAPCARANKQLLSRRCFRYQRASCCVLRFGNNPACCPDVCLPLRQAPSPNSTCPQPLRQPPVLVRTSSQLLIRRCFRYQRATCCVLHFGNDHCKLPGHLPASAAGTKPKFDVPNTIDTASGKQAHYEACDVTQKHVMCAPCV